MHPPAKYLRRSDAAAYVRLTWGIPCSAKWLAKLAVVGGGPVYRKAGRFPIYTPDDLDLWAESRISAPRRSSSVVAYELGDIHENSQIHRVERSSQVTGADHPVRPRGRSALPRSSKRSPKMGRPTPGRSSDADQE